MAAPEIFVNSVIQKFKHKFFIGGLMGLNIFLLWVQLLKKYIYNINFFLTFSKG